ncbi:sugar phosphate isomerase/epimerase family protein [Haloferax namakaokahaiae]|uniref:Sugar phosphate isomerase/epimerase family protein n=1 Tax=Haloferax namakaokahaiae TaxID=1748331 RepID=A0ABD5ZCU4_9EURY
MKLSTDGETPLESVKLGFTLGLGMPFEETVHWAASEGFEFVELLLDGQYARQQIRGRRESMRTTLDEAGLDFVVHLPFSIDPGSPFAPVREGVVTELVAGMEFAADVGAEKVVFHPSSDAWELGWSTDQTLEFVHESLDRLVPAARDRNLVPCLENIVSSYYDVTTFPELLERYPDASMTFDTSHAHLAGMAEAEMAEFFTDYRHRIDHLHLVDTRGGRDEHLPVGMGNLDFEPLFSAIADAGWEDTATLEVGTEDYETIALGKRHVERLASNV